MIDSAERPDSANHSTGHQPRRPEWICASDDHPWPCTEAEHLLRAAHDDDTTLARLLLWLAATAVNDLNLGASAAYRRFVAWTLPADTRCRLCGQGRHDVLPGVPPRLFPCDHERLG